MYHHEYDITDLVSAADADDAEKLYSIDLADIVSVTYNGKKQGPKLTYNGKVLTEGTDYKWNPGGDSGSCVNAGSYDILLFGRGQFAGAIQGTYSIKAKKITPAVTLSKSSYTYNGKVRKPGVTVKCGGTVLKKNTDYTVGYTDGCKNAGKYNVNVKLKGNYEGKKTVSFTINKAANPLKVSAKTATVKYRKVKKKAQTLAVTKVIKFTSAVKTVTFTVKVK